MACFSVAAWFLFRSFNFVFLCVLGCFSHGSWMAIEVPEWPPRLPCVSISQSRKTRELLFWKPWKLLNYMQIRSPHPLQISVTWCWAMPHWVWVGVPHPWTNYFGEKIGIKINGQFGWITGQAWNWSLRFIPPKGCVFMQENRVSSISIVKKLAQFSLLDNIIL